jgi:hypothetical protein
MTAGATRGAVMNANVNFTQMQPHHLPPKVHHLPPRVMAIIALTVMGFPSITYPGILDDFNRPAIPYRQDQADVPCRVGQSMMLRKVRVIPMYHQVLVEVEGATDLPLPETGAEPVVATQESLLVSTQPEQYGHVDLEVHSGPPAGSPGTEIYHGELTLTTPRLVIGNYYGDQLTKVDIGRVGPVPVSVYVDRPDAPSRVTVVLTCPQAPP